MQDVVKITISNGTPNDGHLPSGHMCTPCTSPPVDRPFRCALQDETVSLVWIFLPTIAHRLRSHSPSRILVAFLCDVSSSSAGCSPVLRCSFFVLRCSCFFLHCAFCFRCCSALFLRCSCFLFRCSFFAVFNIVIKRASNNDILNYGHLPSGHVCTPCTGHPWGI